MKKLVVTKKNNLLKARYSLGLNAQRVLLAAVAKLDSRESMPESIVIDASFYSEIYNIPLKHSYTQLREAAEPLLREEVTLQDDDDLWHVCRWVAEFKYYKRQGKLRLWFAPSVRDYLSLVKNNFTSYELSKIAELKSVYSIRLYELLAQYIKVGERSISLEELRSILGVQEGQYSIFANFRARVLDRALTDINAKTNINASCECIKEGRKIARLNFTFSDKAQRNLSF